MNMTQNVDWFEGEEGLALWDIERSVIREALPVAGAGQFLLIGPAAGNHDPFRTLALGQAWYFDPTALHGNPWISDDVSCLPIQDECLDLVILRHCMNADEKARHLLFDVCRVLKPGGHIVLSCLNARGWVAKSVLRGQQPPGLSAGWIKAVSRQTGLSVEQMRSLGFGSLTNRFAARNLPPVLAGFSNLHVCVLGKHPAGGEIRRLVYRLPRRARSIAANTGVYSKTGT